MYNIHALYVCINIFYIPPPHFVKWGISFQKSCIRHWYLNVDIVKHMNVVCTFQESESQKTNNGIQYRLQLLYANGNELLRDTSKRRPRVDRTELMPETVFFFFHSSRRATGTRHIREAHRHRYQTGERTYILLSTTNITYN